MSNVSIVYGTILCLLALEGVALLILFSSKNKFATKITKFLMKTQGISCPRTMQDIDDRINEIIKKMKEDE